MELQLVKSNDPILRKKIPEYVFADHSYEYTVDLATSMVKLMYDNNALGLAAPQVGLEHRVFVMRGSPENFVCFNPRIVMSSEEQIYLEEGCLSFPNLLIKVKRPKMVRVRFTVPDGKTYTRVFTGMTARCFQHELDHLDGVVMSDRANPIHLEKARRELKRVNRIEARYK